MNARVARSLIIAAGLLLETTVVCGQEVRLKHLGTYERQGGGHPMGVETLDDRYALVSGLSITLFDLEAIVSGANDYVDRIRERPNGEMLDLTTSVTRTDGHSYLNVRHGGVAVVFVDTDAGTLTWLDEEISEPGVYYEKMAIAGDLLYVTAHAYGIRIFDLTDPAHPALIGALDEGFDDAWAIAVDGTTAYVADGAGGLKIVDVTDPAAPFVVAGESPESVTGASEDALVIEGRVYVAAGSAGVAVYEPGDIGSRQLFDTPGVARHLAQVGEHLAVADIGGLQIFRIEGDGTLTPVASEKAARRQIMEPGGDEFDPSGVQLRLWHGVSAWGDDRVVVGDWNFVDVYELVDPATDDQPDITASTQRIRFAPSGGSASVQLMSQGSGPLTISGFHSTDSDFTVAGATGVLEPGEAMAITIDYAGGTAGSERVYVLSDDPDESPLPIQVFGETQYLDPGEDAAPFTLEQWTFNHVTDDYEFSVFDLDANVGKIVFFQVFGSW